jgi:hypothetical protein
MGTQAYILYFSPAVSTTHRHNHSVRRYLSRLFLRGKSCKNNNTRRRGYWGYKKLFYRSIDKIFPVIVCGAGAPYCDCN